jgi:hypothetical protein
VQKIPEDKHRESEWRILIEVFWSMSLCSQVNESKLQPQSSPQKMETVVKYVRFEVFTAMTMKNVVF